MPTFSSWWNTIHSQVWHEDYGEMVKTVKRFLRPTDYNAKCDLAERVNDSSTKRHSWCIPVKQNRELQMLSFDNSNSQLTIRSRKIPLFIYRIQYVEKKSGKKKVSSFDQVLIPRTAFPSMRKQMDPGRADRTQFQRRKRLHRHAIGRTYLNLAEAQFRQGKSLKPLLTST